jgi:hypothetical protein
VILIRLQVWEWLLLTISTFGAQRIISSCILNEFWPGKNLTHSELRKHLGNRGCKLMTPCRKPNWHFKWQCSQVVTVNKMNMWNWQKSVKLVIYLRICRNFLNLILP